MAQKTSVRAGPLARAHMHIAVFAKHCVLRSDSYRLMTYRNRNGTACCSQHQHHDLKSQPLAFVFQRLANQRPCHLLS